MDKIAVAGACGFIGSHVVERLRASGRDVVAIDRPEADFTLARAAGAAVASVDLASDRAAEEALRGCPHVVNATGLFDFAASPERLSAVNVGVTRAVVRAARAAGARRVVHLSSVAVYGVPDAVPMPEDGRQRPSNAYGRSKRDGEAAALAEHGTGFGVAVLRPTLVYGPRSRYGQAMMMAIAAQARALGVRSLPLPRGGPLSHHVHVADVAQAVEVALAHPDAPGRCFNVGDDRPLPVGDYVVAVAEALGLRVPARALPAPVWTALRALLRVTPRSVLDPLNRQLARGHRALARRGLAAELVPRLDGDWLDYMADDHAFDTRALRALGHRPAHPDPIAALGEILEWYRAKQWIPAARS